MRDNRLNDSEKHELALKFDGVLGLDLGKMERKKLSKEDRELAKKREKARQDKKYKESDKIREELIKRGHIVDDYNDRSIVSGSVIIGKK